MNVIAVDVVCFPLELVLYQHFTFKNGIARHYNFRII